MYAKIENGAVAVYPYTLTQLQRDHPRVSFEFPVTATTLAARGIVPVVPVAAPSETDTHTVSEGIPTFDGEKWVQTWTMVARPAEEAEARQAATAKRSEIARSKADARADSFVQQFVNMTPAQARAVAATASATLPPPMREWVEKVTLMMLAIAKEQYK